MLEQLDPRTPFIIIGQGDTVQRVDTILRDCSGNAVDLSNANVVLRRSPASGHDGPVETWLCETTPVAGQVLFFWPDGANDVAGEYHIQFIAAWEGKRDTYPKGNYSYEIMRILPLL